MSFSAGVGYSVIAPGENCTGKRAGAGQKTLETSIFRLTIMN